MLRELYCESVVADDLSAPKGRPNKAQANGLGQKMNGPAGRALKGRPNEDPAIMPLQG